jgi:Ca2+-binding EF-hand superfamily protein
MFDFIPPFFRVLRVFRMVRLFQMVTKFSHLQRLRVMLFSFVSCLQAFLWALALLFLFVVGFGILLEDFAILYLQDNELENDKMSDIKTGLTSHWNGMVPTITSLIFSLTGGADYGDLMKPFSDIRPFLGALYMFFVLAITFGLLNVLVGVFVQESEQMIHYDRSLVLQNALEQHECNVEVLSQLFSEIDKDSTGKITLEEMLAALKIQHIKAFFLHLDIDMAHNAKVFFSLLDEDKSGSVDRDEFIAGCMRLKGGAKPLSLEHLVMENKKMRESLDRMMEGVATSNRGGGPAGVSASARGAAVAPHSYVPLEGILSGASSTRSPPASMVVPAPSRMNGVPGLTPPKPLRLSSDSR